MCWMCSARCERCGEPAAMVIMSACSARPTCDTHAAEVRASEEELMAYREAAPLN